LLVKHPAIESTKHRVNEAKSGAPPLALLRLLDCSAAGICRLYAAGALPYCAAMFGQTMRTTKTMKPSDGVVWARVC
jgi:hypothetical protein